MNNKYEITDAELEIMQILWEEKSMNLQDILTKLEQTKTRNKNTIKTLLYRLVDKESVRVVKIGLKEVQYEAGITKKKYLNKQNRNFLEKLYNGSMERMLLNFAEEKEISKEQLEKLITYLESED